MDSNLHLQSSSLAQYKLSIEAAQLWMGRIPKAKIYYRQDNTDKLKTVLCTIIASFPGLPYYNFRLCVKEEGLGMRLVQS